MLMNVLGGTVASAKRLGTSRTLVHSSSGKKESVFPTEQPVRLSRLICYRCPRTHSRFCSSAISLWLSPSVLRWFCTSRWTGTNPREKENPKQKLVAKFLRSPSSVFQFLPSNQSCSKSTSRCKWSRKSFILGIILPPQKNPNLILLGWPKFHLVFSIKQKTHFSFSSITLLIWIFWVC